MNFEKARLNMVEQQIRPWEVLDHRVLEAIADTPRERFVPAEFQRLAYADTKIPIGEGEVMMPPAVAGRMLQALRLRPGDRVLEIGTGTGYVTALLARLAGHVVSVEIAPVLAAAARERLAAMGLDELTLAVGDAAQGWPGQGPYDAIAVTGSVPVLEPVLEEQLKVGGRLFAVVGEPPIMEALLVTRVGAREWARDSLFDTVLPPIQGVRKPERFTL